MPSEPSTWTQLDLFDQPAPAVTTDAGLIEPRLTQHLLFEPDDYHWTTPHWQAAGMPPMHQPDARPLYRLVVHFRNAHDREAFASLLGQPITPKTRSLWHPMRDRMIFDDEQIV